MSYLERGVTPNVGGNAGDAINALQADHHDAPHNVTRNLPGDVAGNFPGSLPYYHLQYPAMVTNQAGWEVQCLADQFGWVNALLDQKEQPILFATREAALAFMDTIAHNGDLEYRVYPSFDAKAKKTR